MPTKKAAVAPGAESWQDLQTGALRAAVDVRSWIDPRVYDAALRGRGAAAA